MPRNKLRKGRGKGKLFSIGKDGVKRHTTTFPLTKKDKNGVQSVVTGMLESAKLYGLAT